MKFSQSYRKYILSIYSTNACNLIDKRRYVNLFLNNVPSRLQFDTASDIILIYVKAWKLMDCPSILPIEHRALNASGDILRLVEMIEYIVRFRVYSCDETCYLLNRHYLYLVSILIELINLITEISYQVQYVY